MKFWDRLRWVAAIVFFLFVAASFLVADPSAPRDGRTEAPLHKAPAFTH